MPSPPRLHDLACVVHLHSTHSDGTGTVPEIAEAARRNALDVVLLTDHDTLAARREGEERWHGSVLVLVGEEVSPPDRDHFLAFGIDEEINRWLPGREIVAAVERAGGFGFAAHPFSQGNKRFRRPGMGWRELAVEGVAGIEVWSFVTDTAERIGGVADVVRFAATPQRFVDHPPERNLAEWDRLCASGRVVGIGGLDAHQLGIRVAGRVPLRLMSYVRSFRHLRTHVLCEELPTRELEHDRAQVYDALREGRCYMAMDSVAPARGFAFWAEGGDGVLPMGAEEQWVDGCTIHAHVPRPASLRIVRDGVEVAAALAAEIEHRAEEPGAYRLEARLEAHGRERTWILSNPIYLRG